jgi:bifunctional non-homologous end joining protein LigD
VKRFIIPRDAPNVLVTPVAGRSVQLTNLDKVYFPAAGFTKGDLLQYYADVAPLIVPYVADRAMVLKRYPGGIDQDFFYMKRTPAGAPAWLRRCPIEHGSGSVIAFPVIDDLAGLLWTINLGCIDLNEWYGPTTCTSISIRSKARRSQPCVPWRWRCATGSKVSA